MSRLQETLRSFLALEGVRTGGSDRRRDRHDRPLGGHVDLERGKSNIGLASLRIGQLVPAVLA
jgi:hypothetical protein